MLYFHGGALQSEFFAGGSFWSQNLHIARDYAGDDPVFAIRIDPFRDLRYVDGQHPDYLSDDDGFQDWSDQTREIQARIEQGYQAVGYDDGVWISAEAMANRRIRRIA